MRRFTVFRTLAVAARIYGGNVVSFAILAVLVYSPLIIYAVWDIHDITNQATGEREDDRFGMLMIVIIAGTYLLSKALAGALAFGVFNQLRDTRVSLGSCVANGIRRLIPVLLTSIIIAIIIGIGTATYVLPGLVAACLSYVAVPAAVIEGLGPFKAFARSVKLVDSAVPRVFVLLVIFIALQVGLYWALAALLDAIVPYSTMARLCAFLALTILFGAFDAVLSSVAYAHLRADRDGVDTAELARVFD